LEHFLSTFAWGMQRLAKMVGALFHMFTHLTEGGGSKAIWAMPYGNNTF